LSTGNACNEDESEQNTTDSAEVGQENHWIRGRESACSLSGEASYFKLGVGLGPCYGEIRLRRGLNFVGIALNSSQMSSLAARNIREFVLQKAI
jgi:hypothetical protein